MGDGKFVVGGHEGGAEPTNVGMFAPPSMDFQYEMDFDEASGVYPRRDLALGDPLAILLSNDRPRPLITVR